MVIIQRKRPLVGMCSVVLIGTLAGGFALPCAAGRGLFEDKLEAVSLTGIHHMGIKFKVDEFVVEGTDGGNVGWEGGGVSITCCVELPRTWRPGLSVLARWAVSGRPLFAMRLLLSTSFVEDQISKRHESDTCCRFAANAAEID